MKYNPNLMKKYPSLPLCLLALFVWLLHGSAAYAQQIVKYSPEVELRIKQVEENLTGAVQVEGQGAWNIKDRITFHKIPGVSIAVIRNYKLEWAKGYGWADASEKREVTPQTLFQAASISKSLNGVGVLKLVQNKKLDLKTDINAYLKSWKFPYDSLSKGKKITLSNLLSHTAGLSVHGFRGYAKGETIPSVVQILNGLPPANNQAIRSQFEPDHKVQYSGGGTTISQLITMDVTGQPYDTYMRENVLKPLGMTSSFYKQPGKDNTPSLLATGYKGNGEEVTGKYHVYPEQAAASLWTNPTELCYYIIETQLSLQGKSAKVLTPEFTKLRLTPYMGAAGLGVFIDTKGNEKYFQHSGGNEGFRSQYYGSMTNGNGVVVMVNSDNGAIIPEIIGSVASAYGWENFNNTQVKKIVQLTEGQLKTYEGYYESQVNKNTYIRFTAKENQLMLTQLWDGREILFSAESDLDFFCKEFPFPLKFTKDKDGSVTEVLAFNKDVWVKDSNYKPVVRKAITLTPSQLKILEGKYQVQQNKALIVQVTAKEDHLLVKQLWDGEELIFIPESELEFFAKDNQFFPVKFIRDKDGVVTQLLAFNRDMLDRMKE
jgi:CubicO group peptidase (beta-lactamase class C family)